MAYEFAKYEKKGRIAYVTINRPEVMNALHIWAHAELHEMFTDFRDDPEVWIAIVTGAGDKAFCAGNDLKVSAGASTLDRPRPALYPSFGGMTLWLECYKPIIAAVNGFALGGGFEIVMASDIIVAADHAQFGLPEPRVGVLASDGGMVRLPRQVPWHIAMGMLVTGKRISAQEAYRVGLVNEVVPLAELMPAAERWANEILECAPINVRASKETAVRGAHLPIEVAREQRYEWVERFKVSEDRFEGPKAFVEKRKPQWKGR